MEKEKKQFIMKIKFDHFDNYNNVYRFDDLNARNLFLHDIIKICANNEIVKVSLDKSKTRSKNELLHVNILPSQNL